MNIKEAIEQMRGRFDLFAVSFAPQLNDVIYAPKGRKVTCPVHGVPKKFNVHPHFPNNGKWYSYIEPDISNGVFSLLMWVTGASASEVLKAANEFLGVQGISSPAEIEKRKNAYKEKQEKKYLKNRANLRKLWISSSKATKNPLEYLSSRGINLTQVDNILFNPSTYFRSEELNRTGDSPALIVRVDDVDGNAVTLHRIYVNEDNTKSEIGKMMMPPVCANIMGSAARLFPFEEDGVLGIAEGVETACAVKALFNMPCWAAISAPMLEGFIPPKGVKRVVIWADKDRSLTGQKAAERLKERLIKTGLEALVMLPTQEIPKDAKSVDWLDVLNDLK